MELTIRLTDSQWASLLRELWLRPEVETGALLLADQGGDSSGPWLAVREVVPIPESGYRQRRPDFIEIDPIWMNAQCAHARRTGLSVFTVHTHLCDAPAWFSWADDQGDMRLMPALLNQMPDNLHGSLNVTHSDAIGRVFREGRFEGAPIIVAGVGLRRFPRALRPEVTSPTHHRQALALGQNGQLEVAALRVGVVGLGGTGSIVAALLGRLGVRRFVLIDGDTLEGSNFSRVLESVRDDVQHRVMKTTIACRALQQLDDCNELMCHAHPLADEHDLTTLANCDLVFSCVDLLSPRALLNRFSYEAHVPVIDMGSAFRVDETGTIVSQGGKVVIIGPGRPCLWCWGDLDAERIRVESLAPEERQQEAQHGYITGADEPQPSVISFNASLAAAAVTEMLRMVTGFAHDDTPTQRLNFNFATGTVTRARRQGNPACRFCGGQEPHRGQAE